MHGKDLVLRLEIELGREIIGMRYQGTGGFRVHSQWLGYFLYKILSNFGILKVDEQRGFVVITFER